jgi:hypothetical protein
MNTARTKQQEIDANLEFFKKNLPTFLEQHRNKYALIRNCEVVDFYETVLDAQSIGEKLFKDDLFSIQKVTDATIDLGFVHLGAA